jgi:hypothetical protein
LGAGFAGITFFSLFALGAGFAGVTLFTLLALDAGFTGISLFALDTRLALDTLLCFTAGHKADAHAKNAQEQHPKE